jgi:tetratricopeptide (TPR) repeat protein
VGQKAATYANDPNETQIQYNLYRIPFNDGKGGKPEPVLGASFNGMSNNFPKVSPDGKWIVFVENKNGLLMRPDSKLYIVPFWGGKARELACNLPVMNSWHTWSPNGHWLAWSSKSPSLYTELYLTHIDKNGNASPAIQIEDATASNRAVNIPQFINVPRGGLEHILHPATDFYKQFDDAAKLSAEHEYPAAVTAWKKAIAMNDTDPRAFNEIGIVLAAMGKLDEAIANYRRSLSLNPDSSPVEANLGSALAAKGDFAGAQKHLQIALRINPDNPSANISLGNVLSAEGGHAQQSIELLLKGLEKQPSSPDGQNGLGIALAHAGNLADATTHLQKAVDLAPGDAGYHYNLGRVLAARGMFSNALPEFQRAAQLTNMQDPAILQMLAGMYSETGNYAEAVTTAESALQLARQQQKTALAQALQENLARYQAQAQGATTANSAMQN